MSQDSNSDLLGYDNFGEFLESMDSPSELFNNMDTDFMDIKQPYPFQPVEISGPPPRGDFAGKYNFDVRLSSESTNRKNYVFSHDLNRVYLKMMAEMAVQFAWDWEALKDRKLWVRATTILARSEHQEARVLRCLTHKEASDLSNKGVAPRVIDHVLRSTSQGPEIVYCGHVEDDRSWLSVAQEVPSMPPKGMHAIQNVYQFCCKHSCIAGINRRPIEVLFTLEDCSGDILGRRSLGIRVCSCPRRDMDKDEMELKQNNEPPTKKKRLTHVQQPHCVQQNTNSSHDNSQNVLLGIYHLCMAGVKLLPPNNSEIPRLNEVAENIKKQIENQNKNS